MRVVNFVLGRATGGGCAPARPMGGRRSSAGARTACRCQLKRSRSSRIRD